MRIHMNKISYSNKHDAPLQARYKSRLSLIWRTSNKYVKHCLLQFRLEYRTPQLTPRDGPSAAREPVKQLAVVLVQTLRLFTYQFISETLFTMVI